MKISIIAISGRQPAWVNDGVNEYLKRFPRGWQIEMADLPLGKRAKNTTATSAISDEGRRLLARVTDRQVLVALDERGKSKTTPELAHALSTWAESGKSIAFAIGGPDGHADELIDRADLSLALSAMTLPHGLVRIMLVEQLYRCWSVINRHPYHRA